ncbi:MAG: alpha-L-arabinofuranosidase C-terminal domain-containing protein [Bacteroidales bacterium]|nr:alpha-L-arabinofuranosidase C-terminal domain-containing protein [Bacteroidales bacterium]
MNIFFYLCDTTQTVESYIIKTGMHIHSTHLYRRLLLFFALLAMLPCLSQAEESELSIVIHTKKMEFTIPNSLFGFNLSDINSAFDGGLYAELVKNRSFEYDFPMMGWTPFGNVKIDSKEPCFENAPHYIHLLLRDEPMGVGIENEGFRGIPVTAGERYRFSCFARNYGVCDMKLIVELVSPSNVVICAKELTLSGKRWTKYITTLTSPITEGRAKLRISSRLRGAIDIDHVSLFPTKTFHNHPGGLRNDLAEAIADSKPQVLRFPGGNPIDRKNVTPSYSWKNTLTKVENRPTDISRWNYTIDKKKFPEYFQTYGFGLYEFLSYCEEIGAEPMLVVDCGLSSIVNNPKAKSTNVEEVLEEHIQDALDLIEFVNDAEEATWGEVRTEMGHPDPFNIKNLTIADNAKTSADFEYLSRFVEAIKHRYPKMELIGSAGTNPDAKEMENRIEFLKNCDIHIVDEQLFRSPEWFLANANKYDNYKRNTTKIVIGEMGATENNARSSLNSALREAAFMTGIERNADVVETCVYAPLLANAEAWQCAPDLIWFDNLRIAKTASYYVQQLFALHQGTHALSTTLNNQAIAGEKDLFASSQFDKNRNQIIVKIVNYSNNAQTTSFLLEGLKRNASKVIHHTLTSVHPELDNSLDNPNLIPPTQENLSIKNNILKVSLSPKSLHIFIFQL